MELLVLFTIVLVQLSAAEELPSFIHACRRSDPNLEACIIETSELLKEHLAEGVPEYHIPALEPLVIDELLREDTGGLHITAGNVKTWGCTEYKFQKASFDLDKQTYDIDLDIPMLEIMSQYNVSGKLLMMPVKGHGPMYANVTDLLAKVHMSGELFDVDGEQHLRFTKMTIKTTVGGGSVKLENLFNGDKMLNDIVNDAINKNLDTFLHELLPIIERALASTFLDIANKIVTRFSFKQLFPE